MEEKATVYSAEIDDATYEKMRDFYSQFSSKSPNEYIDIFAQGHNVSVAIYKKNKKGIRKVVFQGERAITEAKMFFKDAKSTTTKKIDTLAPSLFPQIGSDEVGTGDVFGPICVAAAFVRKEDLPLLKELGVTDSKQMTDEKILEIGPKLINSFVYSQLSLPNNKFNEVHDDINMNAIKAKMHNQCYINVLEKVGNAHIYQDQFAEPSLYFSYLKDVEQVVRNVTFHTKGESYYPSVALGSVIARYSFLRKMKEMDEKYGMHFPLGSSNAKTEEALKEFIERFGKKELSNVAKLNFKNVTSLL